MGGAAYTLVYKGNGLQEGKTWQGEECLLRFVVRVIRVSRRKKEK